MKVKKSNISKKDESLFGLLSQYKSCASFFRVLASEEKNSVVIQISDNPSKWLKAGTQDERFKGYKILRRLEMGIPRASLKYLSPEIIAETINAIFSSGTLKSGVKINNKSDAGGIIEIVSSYKYLKKMLQALNKLLNITPQKKYSIIEKHLSTIQEKDNDRTI